FRRRFLLGWFLLQGGFLLCSRFFLRAGASTGFFERLCALGLLVVHTERALIDLVGLAAGRLFEHRRRLVHHRDRLCSRHRPAGRTRPPTRRWIRIQLHPASLVAANDSGAHALILSNHTSGVANAPFAAPLIVSASECLRGIRGRASCRCWSFHRPIPACS